ncbi:hypothetical protein SAMN05518855_100832 [Paenibacillus sp. CF384]|nr:hypothetical protein SAMN05518855_100832 [Paenibacillus sp. CF384]
MIERNSTYNIEKAVLGYTDELARLQVQVLMGGRKSFVTCNGSAYRTECEFWK